MTDDLFKDLDVLKNKIANFTADVDDFSVKLSTKMAELEKKNSELKAESHRLQVEKGNIERLALDLQNERTLLENEKATLIGEKDALSAELDRIGKLYEQMTGRESKEANLRDLLSIYITLIEQVFSGRSHFKVLTIMHGEKTLWRREELAKASGISTIEIRTVIGDLTRYGLIEFNEETAEAKLKQRIIESTL